MIKTFYRPSTAQLLTFAESRPDDVALQFDLPAPQVPADSRLVQLLPEEIGGVWYQRFAVQPMTPQEQQEHLAQQKVEFSDLTQRRLDLFAQTRGYDDIRSACEYAGCSVPKYAAEGTYCKDARAQTWAAYFALWAQIDAGTRDKPREFADIEGALPALAWPE